MKTVNSYLNSNGRHAEQTSSYPDCPRRPDKQSKRQIRRPPHLKIAAVNFPFWYLLIIKFDVISIGFSIPRKHALKNFCQKIPWRSYRASPFFSTNPCYCLKKTLLLSIVQKLQSLINYLGLKCNNRLFLWVLHVI